MFWRGIERTDRSTFAAGFADAHWIAIRNDIPLDDLRAMLTRAGGEVVDRP